MEAGVPVPESLQGLLPAQLFQESPVVLGKIFQGRSQGRGLPQGQRASPDPGKESEALGLQLRASAA